MTSNPTMVSFREHGSWETKISGEISDVFSLVPEIQMSEGNHVSGLQSQDHRL